MQKCLYGIVFGLLGVGSANAALLSRLSGQAYYDTELNITWVADANLAQSSGYDADGRMSWLEAQAWIASLNTTNYLGVNGWRLPTVIDTGPIGCYWAYSGSDCGWNVQTKSGSTVYSEMAHLHHATLVNSSLFDASGFPTIGSCQIGPNYCLTSAGPFANFQHGYWSGLTGPYDDHAWWFFFPYGEQGISPQATPDYWYAWAVRDGDIDADGDDIPENADNCTLAPNPGQCDSDGDGYGNQCDGDMNNNSTTNSQDYVLFRAQLGQPSVAPTYNKADLNCNGAVNAQDYVLFRGLLGSPAGPSGLYP